MLKMKTKKEIIEIVGKDARKNRYRWDLEKVIENALSIYEKEIINEIENWSIVEMDSDIQSQDIEELKERVKLK
jgi:hypothetical protein